jgi:hypothetical protein
MKIGMIHYTSDPFQFDEITLSQPTATQGGSFFSKIHKKGDPLYIYSPKCRTTGLGPKHADFMFKQDDSFVRWVESLEEKLQALIFERRNAWFVTEALELDDIQHAFMSMLKYKGGQYSLRGHIPIRKHPWKETLHVYNEEEVPVPVNSIKDSTVMAILEVHGIQFNDKSFQVMVQIRQIMVFTEPLFSECRIKIKEELIPVDISNFVPIIKEVPNSG